MQSESSIDLILKKSQLESTHSSNTNLVNTEYDAISQAINRRGSKPKIHHDNLMIDLNSANASPSKIIDKSKTRDRINSIFDKDSNDLNNLNSSPNIVVTLNDYKSVPSSKSKNSNKFLNKISNDQQKCSNSSNSIRHLNPKTPQKITEMRSFRAVSEKREATTRKLKNRRSESHGTIPLAVKYLKPNKDK